MYYVWRAAAGTDAREWMPVARFAPATKLNFQENITGRIDQMSEQASRRAMGVDT